MTTQDLRVTVRVEHHLPAGFTRVRFDGHQGGDWLDIPTETIPGDLRGFGATFVLIIRPVSQREHATSIRAAIGSLYRVERLLPISN
jgi:hypothetical protein